MEAGTRKDKRSRQTRLLGEKGGWKNLPGCCPRGKKWCRGAVTDGDSHLADMGDPFPGRRQWPPSRCGGSLGGRFNVEPGQA